MVSENFNNCLRKDYHKILCKNLYDGYGHGIFICSECKNVHIFDYDMFENNYIRYCPYCGAKVISDE